MCGYNGNNMQLTICAWNTEKDNNSFDCEYSEKLHQYFISAQPIPSLLLMDPKATWNQELENVFLTKCENRHDYKHYEYELRPDCV